MESPFRFMIAVSDRAPTRTVRSLVIGDFEQTVCNRLIVLKKGASHGTRETLTLLLRVRRRIDSKQASA